MIEFESVRLLRERLAATEAKLDSTRDALLFLSSKLGQFEQQRNKAREKLGVGKRRWREDKAAMKRQIAALFARVETLTGFQPVSTHTLAADSVLRRAYEQAKVEAKAAK